VPRSSRTTSSPASATAFFHERFRAVGTPARAAQDRAYLKSGLRFYGATVPEIRRAASDFAREHREMTHAELRAIVSALYGTDRYELRSSAIALLGHFSQLLRERDLPWLIGLVRRSDTWAHVDWLAADIIGGVIEREPAGLRRLSGWADDRSFWVRRTALLAQLRALSRGAGDFPLFVRLAAGMLDEREFFIRKAIGWILREVSKKRPALTYAFMREHREAVSALTIQEGAKYLPAAMRLKLGLPAKAAWQLRDERNA
jgi:3-methyladenine DNA glycosylase AlkD